MMFIDARLPVRFGSLSDRAPGEAVLTDGDVAITPPVAAFSLHGTRHPVDCACCAPRSAAAMALASLFRERAVGTAVPFRAVLAMVSPEGEIAVREALATDAFASARFRLG